MHVSALEFPGNSLPHTMLCFGFSVHPFCTQVCWTNQQDGLAGTSLTETSGSLQIPQERWTWSQREMKTEGHTIGSPRSHLLAASLICHFLRLQRCRHQIHRHFIFEKEFYVHDNAQASYPPSAAKITHCCTEFSDSVGRNIIFCAISTLSRPFCSQSSPRFLLYCTSRLPFCHLSAFSSEPCGVNLSGNL